MYASTIARTLNASYSSQSYGGLGGVATTYPVSAFVTHMIYLKNASVEVEVGKVAVREMDDTGYPSFLSPDRVPPRPSV